MGASQSAFSGGHHSHREGRRHRLKRVDRNEVRAVCGMCSQHAEIGKVAYRCRSCGFVVHEACYRLPKKISHFAHSVHPLTLCDRLRDVPAAGSRTSSCSICAVSFDDVDGGSGGPGPSPSFVYGCTRCHGFYAHPHCCDLPKTMHNTTLHQHALTLLAPPPPPPQQPRRAGRKAADRRCLNAVGKCRNATSSRGLNNSAAWSYQCNPCGVEICLACQMPGDAAVRHGQHGGCGNVVETVGAVGQQLATAMGTALHALCCASLGAPMPPPQQVAAASK